MKILNILNLGAGVQSTMLYLLACEEHPAIGRIDAAIFADTGDEPAAVYDHLEWLKGLDGPEIITASLGSSLGDDLISGRGPNRRFSAMPVFTGKGSGRGPRHCSRDYKIDVVVKAIRQNIVGLKHRQHFPKNDINVVQFFGLSSDEARRVLNVKKAYYGHKWATARFPLFETNTDRAGAKQWLRDRVPHEVPRSACVFCPCHDDKEWLYILNGDPNNPDWKRAIEIDEALRDPCAACTRGRKEDAFLHRSCVPLAEIDFNDTVKPLELAMDFDCMGMCGV